MTKDAILGLVRHILTFGAGIVIAKGWVDEAATTQAIAGIMAIVGVAWSFFDKKQRNAQ